MKNKGINLTGIIFFSLLTVALISVQPAEAQAPSIQDAKPTGQVKAENKAKLPPTVKQPLVPDLRLKGAESVELNAVVPKSYYKVTFLFQNWDKFPAEMLLPTRKPPSLPPDPCSQVKTSTRLFAILAAENKTILGCTELKPTEDFYFLLEKEKPIPDFVYVSLVDRQTGKTYKSTLVSPSSGVTK